MEERVYHSIDELKQRRGLYSLMMIMLTLMITMQINKVTNRGKMVMHT